MIEDTTMTTKSPESAQKSSRSAEKKNRLDDLNILKVQFPEGSQDVLQELLVHQVELEMQNEELRLTQQELVAAKARYFDLYDLAPVGYLTLNKNGLIVEANLTAVAMFGVAQKFLRQTVLSKFILAGDEDSYYRHRKQLYTTGEFQKWNMRFIRGDGSIFWAYLQCTVTDDGKMRVTFSDITDRKQAEEKLQALQDGLERLVRERTDELALLNVNLNSEVEERKQSEWRLLNEKDERLLAIQALREKEQMLISQNRQAAMGEMIGNIAHQWRQPLNALGLFIQRLGFFYDTPHFNKKFLDTFVDQSMETIQYMSKTINDFRDYFKPDKEKSDFHICGAVKNTLSLLDASFLNPEIRIVIVENDDPIVYGYQNEFAQVLLNILVNARDVIIEREISEALVTVTVWRDGENAVVTVADNAGGIADDIIHKIFDPYFTTKGPQLGTGIGLFLSKSIVEKNMGGKLSVRNTDVGAEFRVEV